MAYFERQPEERDPLQVGPVIRARRYELRMTQVAMASALDVTDRTVSDWERHRHPPSDVNLTALAKLLGLPLSQLREARERSYAAGCYQAPSRRGQPVLLERLDRLRLLWAQDAMKRGDTSKNPYSCAHPDCNDLGDPAHHGCCSTHHRRLLLTGTVVRDPCLRCGAEVDAMSPFLCRTCYQASRWCSYPDHRSDRLMAIADMNNATRCKACGLIAAGKRRRAWGVTEKKSRPPCGSPNGYLAHYYRGEEICDACREAWRIKNRDRWRKENARELRAFINRLAPGCTIVDL